MLSFEDIETAKNLTTGMSFNVSSTRDALKQLFNKHHQIDIYINHKGYYFPILTVHNGDTIKIDLKISKGEKSCSESNFYNTLVYAFQTECVQRFGPDVFTIDQNINIWRAIDKLASAVEILQR